MTTTFRLTKTVSFLPEDVQNLLLYWQDKFKQGYFEIGDIAGDIVEAFTRSGEKYTQQQIFNEVGRFCGKSGRTIRYYYETAAYYGVETRERYHMLPFSTFVFARHMGDRWYEVLEFAKKHMPVSEDALRIAFLGDINAITADTVFATVGSDTLSIDTNPTTITMPKEVIRLQWLDNVDRVRQGAKYISEQMSQMSLDEDKKQLIEWLVNEIELTLPTLIEAVEKIQ